MHTRMRLGELLLASGLLSADQLEAALQGQRSSGMKLGEYLIKQGICREIGARTGGDIYIGVVGPVRSGKSTFIKRFMEQLVLPAIGQLRKKSKAAK